MSKGTELNNKIVIVMVTAAQYHGTNLRNTMTLLGRRRHASVVYPRSLSLGMLNNLGVNDASEQLLRQAQVGSAVHSALWKYGHTPAVVGVEREWRQASTRLQRTTT